VKIRAPHSWPATVEEAARMQDQLRPLVRSTAAPTSTIRTAAGLDVAYATGSDRVAAAVVVLDVDTLRVVDSAVAHGSASFPYAAGFLAFRELPALVDALERLSTTPDVLVCDGQGLAHPRRFGLACHVGVLTGLPTIGVAKTPLGHYEPPAAERGAWTSLHDSERASSVVGRAFRTQDGVKPVFVSVGHKIDLDTACQLVLTLTPRYRLPETTRRADQLARSALGAGDA
jgi:deoxyribonuclease V